VWIAPFFSHPPLIGLFAAHLVLVAAAFAAAGNLSFGEREDRSNRWILVAFSLILFLDGHLPAYIDRVDFWTLDGDSLRWFGVFLFAVGGDVRIWPVSVLGRRFSGLVAIQAGHTQVTTGIYHAIRHPIYLGMLVDSLGSGLAFRSGVGVLLLGSPWCR
jgi:protein-S-isoprenylcysteine O-methyltransferase Ste14